MTEIDDQDFEYEAKSPPRRQLATMAARKSVPGGGGTRKPSPLVDKKKDISDDEDDDDDDGIPHARNFTSLDECKYNFEELRRAYNYTVSGISALQDEIDYLTKKSELWGENIDKLVAEREAVFRYFSDQGYNIPKLFPNYS